LYQTASIAKLRHLCERLLIKLGFKFVDWRRVVHPKSRKFTVFSIELDWIKALSKESVSG
jgi:hypothetical protein